MIAQMVPQFWTILIWQNIVTSFQSLSSRVSMRIVQEQSWSHLLQFKYISWTVMDSHWTVMDTPTSDKLCLVTVTCD